MDEDEVESPELDEVVEQPEEPDEEGETPEPEEKPDDEEDEHVLSIAGEETEDVEDFKGPAPKWVKETREVNKELRKKNRELEQKLASSTPKEPETLSKEPELGDFDYDEPKFKAAYTAWVSKKSETEHKQREQRQAQEKATAEWQTKLQKFNVAKSTLKFKDYSEAEAVAEDALSETQRGMIIDGFDSEETAATVLYALGKNPKKLKELASQTNLVKFAFAVAKLETQLKVTPRKAAPLPEKTVRGSAAVGAGSDATLARLEKEAERTNDRTKIVQYKKSLKLKTK